MSTWHVSGPSRHMVEMYRRLRRPIIWKLDKSGQIVTARRTRGRLTALIALFKYWRAPVQF